MTETLPLLVLVVEFEGSPVVRVSVPTDEEETRLREWLAQPGARRDLTAQLAAAVSGALERFA